MCQMLLRPPGALPGTAIFEKRRMVFACAAMRHHAFQAAFCFFKNQESEGGFSMSEDRNQIFRDAMLHMPRTIKEAAQKAMERDSAAAWMRFHHAVVPLARIKKSFYFGSDSSDSMKGKQEYQDRISSIARAPLDRRLPDGRFVPVQRNGENEFTLERHDGENGKKEWRINLMNAFDIRVDRNDMEGMLQAFRFCHGSHYFFCRMMKTALILSGSTGGKNEKTIIRPAYHQNTYNQASQHHKSMNYWYIDLVGKDGGLRFGLSDDDVPLRFGQVARLPGASCVCEKAFPPIDISPDFSSQQGTANILRFDWPLVELDDNGGLVKRGFFRLKPLCIKEDKKLFYADSYLLGLASELNFGFGQDFPLRLDEQETKISEPKRLIEFAAMQTDPHDSIEALRNLLPLYLKSNGFKRASPPTNEAEDAFNRLRNLAFFTATFVKNTGNVNPSDENMQVMHSFLDEMIDMVRTATQKLAGNKALLCQAVVQSELGRRVPDMDETNASNLLFSFLYHKTAAPYDIIDGNQEIVFAWMNAVTPLWLGELRPPLVSNARSQLLGGITHPSMTGRFMRWLQYTFVPSLKNEVRNYLLEHPTGVSEVSVPEPIIRALQVDLRNRMAGQVIREVFQQAREDASSENSAPEAKKTSAETGDEWMQRPLWEDANEASPVSAARAEIVTNRRKSPRI